MSPATIGTVTAPPITITAFSGEIFLPPANASTIITAKTMAPIRSERNYASSIGRSGFAERKKSKEQYEDCRDVGYRPVFCRDTKALDCGEDVPDDKYRKQEQAVPGSKRIPFHKFH